MKAAVCRAFNAPLTIEEVELAPPGPGEIQVKVAACAICHSDIHYMDGAWGGELPAVFGHEAAGVVEACGPGTAFAPGDHVVVTLIRTCGHCHYCVQGDVTQCEGSFPLDARGPLRAADGGPMRQGLATGAFAEQVVVDASQAVKVPADLPADRAALLGCGVITGVGAVFNTAAVPPGSTVAVIGTGGVGLNTVQGAALAGAAAVIALDVADDKLAAAKAFGATHVVNARTENAREAVRALTDGRGASYVFVTVGAGPVIDQAFGLLAKSGTLVIVGMTASEVTSSFRPVDVAYYGQRVLGSRMGSSRISVDIPRLVALYRQGRLKLDELITGRYPLAAINDAIASVRRGEALRNVIVL